MPITIRELIASDTISQAVDKINFNFDQLLLNGGGPRGPVGPAGPIGPIGGRGIRGSVWYEGLGDPVNNPPTLTPEDEDNYLQANGDVWTYSEAGGTWINTGINLRGPVGPAGTSGKFSDYRVFPYDVAGDTTIYPNPMTLSGDGTNKSVKTVIVGGLPSNIAGNPASGNEVIDASLAQALVQPAVSLLVHQFDANGGGIKFHGGDPLGSFSNSISQLSSIRLFADDVLTIQVPKSASSATVGFQVLTAQRNQFYQAGKEIKFQTGVTTASISGSNSFIVEADRNGTGGDPTIELKALAGGTAELIVGGTSASFGPAKNGIILADAGQITMRGDTSITGQAQTITLNGTNSAQLFAGLVTLPAPVIGQVWVGAGQQISMFTANGSAGGGIAVVTGNNTPGSILLSTGSASTGNIAITTAFGTGDVNISSGTDVNLTSSDDFNLTAGNDIDIIADGSITGVTTNNSSPISFITLGASSNISLATIGSNIVFNSNSGGRILATANGYMELKSTTDYIKLEAGTDIELNHGNGDRVTIRPRTSINDTARVDIKPSGSGIQSNLRIYGTASGSENMLLRTDDTTKGSIVVSGGMDLELNAGASSTDRVIVLAGDANIVAGTDAPRFSVSAANHYSNHASRISTAPADINIIASGRFVSTTITTSRDLQINWMRVGNVVNCTGVIITGTALPASEIVPLPIGTALLNSVRGVWSTTSSSGTINDSGGTAANFQAPTGITANLFFSFSYVIQ